MKKIIFPLFGIIVFLSSCKKTYTCTCNTSFTFKNSGGGYTNIIVPGSKTAYSQKMSKKQAVEACRHEQTAIQTNFTNGITGNGSSPLLTGESVDTSCGINL